MGCDQVTEPGWVRTIFTMDDRDVRLERDLLASARQGDPAAFEQLMGSYRRELYIHCYRLLGSIQDAEDAVQEAMLAAWRGLATFEGRSSLRAWFYTIATNACLRMIARRPRRMLSIDLGPPLQDTHDLGEPVTEPVWLEPWPDEMTESKSGEADPERTLLRRESVELAFVAALQHLPGNQRAVLILRDVLEFSAAEVADILGTTRASVNSALQRARKAVDQRVPQDSQQTELEALGRNGQRELVDAFVSAWERADVAAILALLAEDARFTMPPLPAWFLGREDVGRFLAERVFATPWRLFPIRANGQLAFACYQQDPATQRFGLGAINILGLHRGQITEIAGFLDPQVHRRFGLPKELPDEVPDQFPAGR